MFRPSLSPPHMATLVILSGISVLSLNMFLPSLSNIARDLEVSYAMASLSVAGYLAVTAVLQIIMGPLSDRYGRRPVLLWGAAIFAVASVGCVLASNIWVFLGFRVLQGAIMSGLALSRAIIRDMFPARDAAAKMGYVAMMMALAPLLGPVLGGFMDEIWGWRSVFGLFALTGALVLVLCWFDLGETNQEPSETFLKQFQSYPGLFTSRRFWGYTLALTFSVGGFYVFIAGIPLVGEQAFGLSPATVGVGVGIISGGFMAGNYISGRVASRYALVTMVIAGRVVGSVGSILAMIVFFAGVTHYAVVFAAAIAVGFGNGLAIPAGNAGAMSVRPKLAGSASGLSGAATVAGGAVLTVLTGALVTGPNGAKILLALVLLTNLAGLAAGLYVRRIDQREGPVEDL